MSDQPKRSPSQHWDSLDDEIKQRLLLGDAAMAWLRKGESIERWREVGIAANDLMVAAMKLANTNNPVGAGYNRAWKDLAEHLKHIRDLDTATRTHAMWLANQWEVVEEWRHTLAASERLRLNHPSAVKRRYEQTHLPPGKAKEEAKKKKVETQERVIRLQEEIDALKGRAKNTVVITANMKPEEAAQAFQGAHNTDYLKKLQRELARVIEIEERQDSIEAKRKRR